MIRKERCNLLSDTKEEEKSLEKLLVIQKLREETLEKQRPLVENFPDCDRIDIDENSKAILHYSFKNGYGARISKNEEEWTIVIVRKISQAAIGDDGPAIELDDWLVTGDLETIKKRLIEAKEIVRK